jgi:hypothetical protein
MFEQGELGQSFRNYKPSFARRVSLADLLLHFSDKDTHFNRGYFLKQTHSNVGFTQKELGRIENLLNNRSRKV